MKLESLVVVTLAESEWNEARSASGTIPVAKRSGINDTYKNEVH